MTNAKRNDAVKQLQSGEASGGSFDSLSCSPKGLEHTRIAYVGSLKCTYSAYTSPGNEDVDKPKENQDAWVIRESVGGTGAVLWGIFDGHGAHGRAVSTTVSGLVAKFASQYISEKMNSRDCFIKSFTDANRLLRNSQSFECQLSGSTGVVAMLTTDGQLHVANLGDSRCVLGRVNPGSNTMTALQLTVDHDPEVPEEYARIISRGGRIAAYMHEGEELGPKRIWIAHENVPGLCMTRAFGDVVGSTVGVIDVPDVFVRTLTQHDRYIIVMSDGVFEFTEPSEIVAMVANAAARGLTPQDAARLIVEDARNRWMREEEGIIDDCTAVVVYLNNEALPSGGCVPKLFGNGKPGRPPTMT